MCNTATNVRQGTESESNVAATEENVKGTATTELQSNAAVTEEIVNRTAAAEPQLNDVATETIGKEAAAAATPAAKQPKATEAPKPTKYECVGDNGDANDGAN